MEVPSSFNDILVDRFVHDHVGRLVPAQRVRTSTLGGKPNHPPFRLHTHRATVWVNDSEVISHEGGYAPFEMDISHLVSPGSSFRMTAVVNNELNFHSLPPGIVEDSIDGRHRQRQFHDFYNYAGLHRNVWIYSTSRTSISDIKVETDAEKGTGYVRCITAINGNATGVIRLTLRDDAGTTVATADVQETEFLVASAGLQQGGRPPSNGANWLWRFVEETPSNHVPYKANSPRTPPQGA
jgi:beta-glucuronidase